MPFIRLAYSRKVDNFIRKAFSNTVLKQIKYSRTFSSLNMALSPKDPSSFSRPDLVAVTHVHLKLNVNFDKNILEGHVILDAEKKIDETADSLILDARNLTLINVKNEKDDSNLDYTVGETVSFGSKLSIKLPKESESEDGKKRYKIKIKYETSTKATALQWLEPEQTSGKKYPYLFSQCQAIHARSMLPCQDTPYLKATYSAEITTPVWATVLMSALHDKVEDKNNFKISRFHQPIPIPSYLIAIAVGDLVSKKVGPKSSVWSEKELIEESAYEFAETDTMLQTAEKICGPYVWGVYDLLVLPPSFAFGGMENPCLTFITPTLIAGDRSLATVVAHEISHSWTGNLVTNANFEHFWLNEGFTMFIEYKINGRMFGEKQRQFNALMGLSELREAIKSLNETPELTKLVVNLTGVDPDDAFSSVPYMKGHTFLYYLEELLGGPQEFEPFLRDYFETFKYKSIVTSDWKNHLYKYFSNKTQILDSVDWDSWLNKPGMPPVIPNYNTDLLNACTELANKWFDWKENTVAPFERSDITNLSASQKEQFVTVLFENNNTLSVKKLQKMQEIYDFDSVRNSEIKFMWIRLALKSRWESKVTEALEFVSKIGRMKFVRPIYRDLYAWTEMRQRAIDNYMRTKDQMMYVTSESVRKELHLDN